MKLHFYSLYISIIYYTKDYRFNISKEISFFQFQPCLDSNMAKPHKILIVEKNNFESCLLKIFILKLI